MTDERLAEIENRLSNSTSEQILEREDYDYYQGGVYLGTKPYCYVDGKRIEGFEQNVKDGDLYFHNDIFKVEGSEGDKLLFINAHKDIADLIAALRTERAKVAELQKELSDTKKKAYKCVDKVRQGLGAGGHGSGMYSEIAIGNVVLDGVQDYIDEEF